MPGSARKAVTRGDPWAGSSWAFGVAAGVILVWGLTGPIFGYSDTWQLVINTGTTIVTFLMVFLIQSAQNKESKAIHLKLNELVAATQGASNHLIDVENLTEEEIEALHRTSASSPGSPRSRARCSSHTRSRKRQARSEAKAPAPKKVGARLKLAGGLLLAFGGSRESLPFRCGREFPIRSGA